MLTLEKGDRGCGRPYSDPTPTGLRPTSYQTPTIHTPTGLLGWEGWEGCRHRLLSAALACESTYSSHVPFGDCIVAVAGRPSAAVQLNDQSLIDELPVEPRRLRMAHGD